MVNIKYVPNSPLNYHDPSRACVLAVGRQSLSVGKCLNVSAWSAYMKCTFAVIITKCLYQWANYEKNQPCLEYRFF